MRNFILNEFLLVVVCLGEVVHELGLKERHDCSLLDRRVVVEQFTDAILERV